MIKAIGGVYTKVSKRFNHGILGGVSRSLKATTHDSGVAIEIPVKEATKKGFAIARGGATASTTQCPEAKQEEEESG